MQCAAEGDVIIPGGTGNKFGPLCHVVHRHDDITGITVIGLGNFEHQEHLGPGFQVEILLILFGIIIQNRVPPLGKPGFDLFRCRSALFHVISHINVEKVVFQRHVVHPGERQLDFQRIRNMVIFQNEPVVRFLKILFLTEQIVTQILTVHPEIHELGIQSDTHVVCKIEGNLIADQCVIEVVGKQGPFL